LLFDGEILRLATAKITPHIELAIQRWSSLHAVTNKTAINFIHVPFSPRGFRGDQGALTADFGWHGKDVHKNPGTDKPSS